MSKKFLSYLKCVATLLCEVHAFKNDTNSAEITLKSRMLKLQLKDSLTGHHQNAVCFQVYQKSTSAVSQVHICLSGPHSTTHYQLTTQTSELQSRGCFGSWLMMYLIYLVLMTPGVITVYQPATDTQKIIRHNTRGHTQLSNISCTHMK